MHRHYPDGAAAPPDIKVALDHHVATVEPMQEALQAGQVCPLEGQGLSQQFVKWVDGLRAEAGENGLSAVRSAQGFGKQLIRCHPVGTREQVRQRTRRNTPARLEMLASQQNLPQVALSTAISQ